MPRRSRHEGDSLEGVLADVRRLHGPDARVVSAERVITGGIGGLFGRQRYEVVVEVPDAVPGPGAARPPAERLRFPAARRAGIAALLDEADEADRLAPSRADELAVSTGGPDFAALLDELVAETALPVPDRVRPPGPLDVAPGDLVAVVGLADDALGVARRLAAHHGLLTARAGLVDAVDVPHLGDARAATGARAEGVRAGTGTAVAVGVTIGLDGARDVLEALEAEHVHVVVDVSRKRADTVAWVGALRRLVDVRAMTAVGHELTLSPEDLDDLGLPSVPDEG